MALIKCPECELQISDRAISCPHCGYPVHETKPLPAKRKAKKRRRLPNGFGRITELKNCGLRKPFRAMVTVRKDEFGKPIGKIIGYFCTYNDAYGALVEYNRNPYDLDMDITVDQLYDEWSSKYFASIKASSARTITSAWAYCSSIRSMRAKDIRARHLKGCMEEGYRIEDKGPKKGEKVFPSAGVKSRMKSLFNLMFDYAVEYEIVERNYARTFDVSEDIIQESENAKRSHIIFADTELEKLWENVDRIKYVDWILIQCYMGWRPQELAILRLDEINLQEWYMQAGMKTPAGKQRIVPIHSRIRNLVQHNYDFAVSIGSEYLLNDKGQTHAGSWKLTYDKYANRFKKVVNELSLNPDHRPHDPRMTFVTRAKKAGVDENALKRMVGHRIEDITEAVYTERDIEWLRSDIEKIK